MSVALLKIGDGRDEYHEQAQASIDANLKHSFAQVIPVDDREHKLGFHGAIQHGWDQLDPSIEFVVHMEMDFTFNWPIDLDPIIQTLRERRYLTQVALLRNPVNDAEREVGGVIQQFPDSYTQVELPDGRAWVEHSRFFTTNPCVYPRWIADRGWPQRPESEGHFSMHLFNEDPVRRSAFWGHGEQWVRHIGDERAGKGY